MKMTNSIKLTVVALTATLGLATVGTAQEAKPTLPPASTKQNVTYASDIKAILDESCVKCHSGDRPKGRLKLDTLADVLKGGKNGKILKPGDSANSYVVKAIAHLTSDQHAWMPPLNNMAHIKPLTPDQIGLIRAWIDQGAK
ncbi:MAG TPA: c-type cytochrome domain-containing protein [Verrucomicrobiae bacterium]|nr:c-type cytochrome domain-containing protein [Verrucomicrobiae bacterium]